MMFVPGNNPGMMQDAFIYGPDSIMLDLEDSVTMAEKDTARLLVYNALKTIDYGTTEMVVRVNPLSTPYGKKDIEAVVKAGVDVVRMPKTETADEVREMEAEIERVALASEAFIAQAAGAAPDNGGAEGHDARGQAQPISSGTPDCPGCRPDRRGARWGLGRSRKSAVGCRWCAR